MNSADAPVTITVERTRIYHRGGLVPFSWHYTCSGPDGRRFDNSSIVTLRARLRTVYGGNIIVIEPWKSAR